MPQLVNPRHFFNRVVFCFCNKAATTEIPSTDLVPGTTEVRGILRKLCGSYGMGLGVLGHSFFAAVPIPK